MKICHPDGQDVETGEIGEIWLKGPSVSPGYWNKPDQTEAAYHNGWFRSGDMAKRDEDGFHILADRLKDMFISGGENVYPAEIEGVIAAHPAVAEVAVIGVPDARWGEVGVAYVVLRRESADVGALKELCAKTLAPYKRPAHVVYWMPFRAMPPASRKSMSCGRPGPRHLQGPWGLEPGSFHRLLRKWTKPW